MVVIIGKIDKGEKRKKFRLDIVCSCCKNREAVDVIVKTTHGRSGLSRWVYGSVATKVLQEAPCPIFLVRVT